MTPYRFVTPVARRSATGSVAAVYAASARELGARFAPHLTPAPDLHAALWTLLRESLLAGTVPRARKEAVAAAVAVANRCPFCIDAHAAMLHATGEHDLAAAVLRGETPDPVVAWARSTRSAEPDPWPFPAHEAPEYVGTALANHFINRMVDALRPGSPLPGGALRAPARRAAGLALTRTVRRPVTAGPAPIAAAWDEFARIAQRGADLLGDTARAVLHQVVGGWRGEHPPLGGWPADVLAAVPEQERPGARLAVLAALAPYRLTDSAVAAWRSTVGPRGDEELVRVLAYGAFTAVAHLAGKQGPEWMRGCARLAPWQTRSSMS
ncbi:carboxymuconolactone decarboxylase family protein [Dactylosporangium vinaceum]|uniref:Carboxymuconolactone decarboxylase family protein n=1 Tax=Dactylosporangium vinaceum TaxID=53362 RepID=A0ABV5MRU0_9ACTN|nr:carboxymuconolactone decarboxylase family protein [Dactylosporangium vinaceum]UAC00347.1 carboxymuconolactone decarboxylase family protein [Dactylosporangium vinaceum]